MRISNTKEHTKIGLQVGVLAGFALPILHMETLWLAVIAAWACVVVAFELWQWSKSGFSMAYIRAKWLDCIVDIAVGFVAFSLPVAILCQWIAR